jgi:hypothetical protein
MPLPQPWPAAGATGWAPPVEANVQAAYDLGPLLHVLGLGALIALAPLAWIGWRHRHGHPATRWRALTVLTLFLTFDLVLFGAFTRLTDSGLGCPDWPGCYGNASPTGALAEIRAEEARMPTGPVTHSKAWIEMVHRYLATGVGVLVTTLDGKPASLPALKDQWLLVSVGGGACDTRCEQHLYLQRQLRESLGKDKDRMDWVWLVNDQAPVRESLQPALHQATVLRVDGAELARWLEPARGQALEDHLYVVDPLGHWMLRFPAGQDAGTASKVRRDLERLMRGSAGWDKAGRP